MKKCLSCGHDFEPQRPKAIYCSDACRTTAFREKHKKKDAKRGRPKKLKVGEVGISKERISERNTVVEIPSAKYPMSPSECIEPPSGLKGIDLAIWKAEQKTNKNPAS